jgi:hypothetical protein
MHSLACRNVVFSLIVLTGLAAALLPCKADDGLVDVSALPRLDGAQVDPDHSSSTELIYSVPGPVENTIAATKRLLAADGWKPYASPSEEPNPLTMSWKKGAQGLSLFFMMPAGQPIHSAVQYTPDRLNVDLPVPDDATDIVFDYNRPYLSCTTGGAVDATLAFLTKQLATSGWTPLTAADAAGHWPNANLANPAAGGAIAYFINGDQIPIMLSVQRGADAKTKVEIRVPPFAEPQFLEAGAEVSDLPVPKRAISSSGASRDTQSQLAALVPAEIGTVLAFYRREFANRNFHEETTGAAVTPDSVLLTFSSPEATAVLKLGRAYDLTTISLVQKVSPAELAARAKAKKDSDDQFMRDAEDAAKTAIAASDAKQAAAAAAEGPAEALRMLADNTVPVRLPATAEDVDYDSDEGKLEFNSASSFKSVVAFYRAAMKSLGWKEQPSVINAPNLVELDFSKGKKGVEFTIMRMGSSVNVTADGSALVNPAGKSAVADADAHGDAATAQAAPPGSDRELEAEDSGGLPVPKEHTMSEGAQSPFRHQVTASVPADLPTVLAFYRRELGKLGWTENTKSAVVTDDRAVLAFTAPDGPAVLKLDRKDGETGVNLAVKNPSAATQAGIMPKAGQAKLLFGNALPAEATITINNKTVKVSGGVGTKAPDGPSLDLAPGKYPYSIKLPGQAARPATVDVGVGETWGLLIGPGGALPMQMY